MLTAALFIIAREWKQPKCPLRNKMWYIHKMEYYLAAKKELSTDTCYDMDELLKTH